VDTSVRAAIAAAKRPVPNPASVRLMASSLVLVYVGRLLPVSGTLLDVELVFDDQSRCDLVWTLADGGILIDEIKTGMVSVLPLTPTYQLRRYLTQGQKRYGSAFRGVRICYLRAPGFTTTFGPDGTVISRGTCR
jgi:hypothetical protein